MPSRSRRSRTATRYRRIGEARALAADYLSLASERGEPQTRHPWPAVATREALRLIRAQGRLAPFEEEPVEPEAAHVDKSADLQLVLETREALEHIAALTQQQVRIFSLHVAGLSYEEICDATGYSWTQVNRHLVRARRRLRARRGA